MKKTKIYFIVLIVFLTALLTSCGLITVGRGKYSGFYLQYSAKAVYQVGETLNVYIKEKNGSPQSYNVYQKKSDEDYSLKGKISAKESIVMEFLEPAVYSLKVAAVNNNLEQSDYSEVSFTVVTLEQMELQRFVIKNNVVDLMYNQEGLDTYDINSLEVVYYPEYAMQRNLISTPLNDSNITISDSKIKAVGYKKLQQPYTLTFYSAQKNSVKSNMYIRIHNGYKKNPLTHIFAGYVDKNYYSGDWVNFQFMGYANMEEPDDYVVYRKVNGENVLLTQSSGEFQKVIEHGNTYYNVKITETSGYMKLRVYAKINGIESDIYTDVSIELSERPVEATGITLNKTSKTMLLDQNFKIEHTIIPEDTYDKTVTYEVEEGGSKYIEINEDGVITPLLPTSAPVKITVKSNSNSAVYAIFEAEVLNLREEDIPIEVSAGQLSNPLAQTIGQTEAITFTIIGSDYTVKWYLDGVKISDLRTLEYNFSYPLRAEQKVFTAEVTKIEEGWTVTRDFNLQLESAFEICDFDTEYEIDSILEFEYHQTELADTEVIWSVYTSYEALIAEDVGDSYVFEQAGSYKIFAVLKQGGQPIEEKFSPSFNIFENLSTELYNVHVNGYYDGVNYAPHIKWMKLPNNTNITVEIIKDSQAYVFESDDPQYEDNFSLEGFKAPYDICKLSDVFEYRIKTDISNKYTPIMSYEASIESRHYGYLKDLHEYESSYPENFMNRYINNIMEFAKLLNYIQVFRPNAVNINENEQKVTITLYFAIDFDTYENKQAYGEIDSSIQNSKHANAFKLIEAANTAYGAGANGMSIEFGDAANEGVSVTFIMPSIDEITDTTDNEQPAKLLYDYARPSTRGQYNQDFPINDNPQAITVETSSELYLAASWGWRPAPVTGSVAEDIYNKAKDVLNEIIDNNMSDMEKVLAIYDYLCAEIHYDSALYDQYMNEYRQAQTDQERRELMSRMNKYKSFHLEGVFEHKVAVCDGISKAFVLLCAIEGITSIKLGGMANNGNGETGHAWNEVLIDGKWYYIDATWGRCKQLIIGREEAYITVSHYYFKALNEHMEPTHDLVGEAPFATKQKQYYYYTRDEDLYFTSQAEFYEYIENLPSALEDDISVEFIIDYNYPSNDELKDYVERVFEENQYNYIVITRGKTVVVFLFA